MAATPGETPALQPVSAEHDSILDRLRELEKLNSSPVPAEARELSAWFKAFAANLSRHCVIEEQACFPAALALPETAELVLTLQKQHGLILAHAEWLGSLAFVGQYQMIKDVLPRFAALIKEHTDLENTALFPRLDASPECRERVREALKKASAANPNPK